VIRLAAASIAASLTGGFDAMPPAIHAVVNGSMYATVRNSSCRIHGGAIVAGVEAALAASDAAR
jgi:ribose transport system substrate-binding protein